MPVLPEPVAGFISRSRVGRLGTADASGEPAVVPFCYAWDGAALYSAIDAKPKRVAPASLRRIRNIQDNPRVSVVIDEYDEDWERLWWVRADGTARVVEDGPERDTTIRLLRAKYLQYERWTTPFGAATIITVERVTSWTLA